MMLKKIAIPLIIVILIIITTFPLVFKVNSCMPAFFSTDESFGVLWSAWLTKFNIVNHLPFVKTDFIAYPYGVELYSTLVGYIWFAINFILAMLTNPVLVYNIQVLLNIFLTALITYLLVFYLTRNKFAALCSGIAYGFCPYIFVRSWQHLGETYLWPIPLFLWFMLRLKNEKSLRIKALFVLAFILSTINFDVTYYLLVIFGAYLVYLLLKPRDNFRYIRRLVILMIISFLILIPQLFPIILNVFFKAQTVPSAQNTFFRPFEDLFAQSARPLSYLLPSIAHPIFGKFTQFFVGTPLYGMSFTEHTLYLGWVPIILSIVAFRKLKRKRPVSGVRCHVSDEDRFNIRFFVLLAVVAWLWSQPPWWQVGPIRILMPSFFMYKLLPMIRAYCRFGAVVMLAVSVLAGFGLKFILEKYKIRKAKITVAALFYLLILFEFWSYPPFKVLDVSRIPAVYYWVKEQPPKTVIAEYPLDLKGPNELRKLYQTKHEKRMINATIPGTFAHKRSEAITELSVKHTAGVLKWMGVDYVLVHKNKYLDTGLLKDVEELDRIPSNPGLRLIGSFPGQKCPSSVIPCIAESGPIDIYEVIAEPIQATLEKRQN